MHDLTSTSKFLSLILRHKPETIGITLDEHGWADVGELIAGISKTRPFDMEMLKEIVSTDNKQRYSFNDDMTRIRANQGHSIPVDVELSETVPPEILYHGTGADGKLGSPVIDELVFIGRYHPESRMWSLHGNRLFNRNV